MKESTIAAFALATLLVGCGASGGSGAVPTVSVAASASPASGTSSAYDTAYRALTWGSAVTASFTASCTMTFTTTGVPPYHADYYLAPASTQYPTVVATTAVSGTGLSLVPYLPSDITPQSVTISTCPVKAASTTPTSPGAIGYTIDGEAIFDPYEANAAQTPAMSDNASYTFTSNGVNETAAFIDACNSHPTPTQAGYEWHYHGLPTCLVQQIDGNSGPSHIIGFALDGFPIYGGRDINGNVVSVSQLDACNGITSPTPEFPNGAYHYVLPIGVTGSRSSMTCYSGTPVSAMLH